MRPFIVPLLLGSALALAGTAWAQSWSPQPTTQSAQSRAELLVHAPEGIGPGKPLWLGLQIAHAKGWHSYWKNPGDSGLPTELTWTLPPGLQAGQVQWPTPRKFALGELANYGYDGTVLLPVPVTVGSAMPAGPLKVELNASWLACRQECIPENAHFKLSIPAEVSWSLHAAAFEKSWRTAPRQDTAARGQWRVSGQTAVVTLSDLPAAWQGKALEFFPEGTGLIQPGAPWQQTWQKSRWQAEIPLSPQRSESPSEVALVVSLANPPGEGAGLAGVALNVPVPGGWPTPSVTPEALPEALSLALAAERKRSAQAFSLPVPAAAPLWTALLGALLGGLILNLMPCVFPVLAIKVLTFAQHADDRRGHRAAGLAYTAGAVLAFACLGAVLLALRAAGEQLGWGFQLQSPGVVASLAALFTLLGLNLAGLFEFGHMLPSAWASARWKNPTANAFLTGVLATAVASPCTAPFMGASLGLAIALPAPWALAVFAMLGLGMALPYLLASWVPAVARALPRPGAWMATFRQLMAFPMLATVVWLLWILGQQTGLDGAMGLLLLLLALTLLVWALGHTGRTRSALSLLATGLLLTLLWALGPSVLRAPIDTPVATQQGWDTWTSDKQARLLAEGRPVLVDFTAAWCVTCQYNKQTALASQAFLQGVATQKVALLRADWTRRDPEVTRELGRLGRNGVPTYALHAPGRSPQVLSEVLSVAELMQALDRLPAP